TFLRPDPNKEPSVTRAIRTALALHIQRDNAAAIIESNSVDERNQRRNNLFATDTHQLFLNFFRMIDPFDAQLIVDAEDNRAAAGICQRDNSLGNPLGIGQLDLEFEVSVFAATDQTH